MDPRQLRVLCEEHQRMNDPDKAESATEEGTALDLRQMASMRRAG